MSLDSIIFLAPIDDLLIVLAHSFGQAPNGTWTYHSIIDNMEITGFQLTSGQAGSEHAAYQGIGGYWLSIGILSQQWGYIQTPSSSTTVDLNIPYTAVHYACFAQKADEKAGSSVEAWAGVTAISLTNFTLRTHYDNSNYFLSCGQ